LEEDPASDPMLTLQEQVRASERVEKMLSPRGEDGRFPWHAYDKWIGAFWTLLLLSDIGYPAGDLSLVPLRDQVLSWLLSEQHIEKVPLINGRWRRCACQEGSIVLAMLKLDIADDRITLLVDNLLNWQWPDGGWNCDKRPGAHNSSFHETLIPLRALALDARQTGSRAAELAAERAAEVFLKRHLYLRQSDGTVIQDSFIRLHYPPYWHYDILAGLKGLAEAGFAGDPRCRAALDLLESRRLADGGFPCDAVFYRLSKSAPSGRESARWGKTGAAHLNEFVTVDVLYVLKQAGRL
jgi:hypothetical protein